MRALVTGASRGIGRAIVLGLAAAGASCLGINYIANLGRAEEVAAAACPMGCGAVLLPGDIGVRAQAEAVVRRFIEEAGGIDILVNNAGQAQPGSIQTVESEAWERALSVHVNGAFWCCRVAVPAMIAAGGGRILNISSIAGRRGVAGAIAYVTAKAAVIGFTQGLARELADYNILVNAIAPGIVETDFHAGDSEEFRRHSTQNRIPVHRYGNPEEVADAALMVLRNDYITGEVIAVDGGLGMRVA
jgi:NAD(P)-dependent dehydrogenase (short-subunit alcohol dehydrogenase family)